MEENLLLASLPSPASAVCCSELVSQAEATACKSHLWLRLWMDGLGISALGLLLHLLTLLLLEVLLLDFLELPRESINLILKTQ